MNKQVETALVRVGPINLIVTDPLVVENMAANLSEWTLIAIAERSPQSIGDFTAAFVNVAVMRSRIGNTPHVCDAFDPRPELGWFEIEMAQDVNGCVARIEHHDRDGGFAILDEIDWPQE